jgi:ABC-2 type transport system ATP-binding protein
MVIDHGSVIAQGTSAELKSQLGGQRVEVVLDHAADAPRAVIELNDIACGEDHFDPVTQTLCIPVEDVDGIVPTVVRRLDAVAVDVRDVYVRTVTLDDVFLSLTGHTAEEEADDAEGTREPEEDRR